MDSFVSRPDQTSFFLDPGHALAAMDPTSALSKGVQGIDFENVTIALLPTGTEEECIRMILSMSSCMPSFSGSLVLPQQLKAWWELAENMGGWKPSNVRFETHLAPVAYRNAALGNADTGWIAYLDPRMCLVWNPLVIVAGEIPLLAAPVINLPRVRRDGSYASHDHLCLKSSDDGVFMQAMPFVREHGCAGFPALCTGIDSSSAMFKCETLRQLGGFDATLGPDEADVDLAMRYFKAGYRVAVTSAVSIYDDELQSRSEIALRISGVELVGQASSVLGPRQQSGSDAPLRVALVVDVYDWAFSNIAHQIQRCLSHAYDFTILPIGEVGSLPKILMMAEHSDVIHIFWRELLLQFGNVHDRDYVHSLGFTWDEFVERFVAGKKITTSIYDHLYQCEESLAERAQYFGAIAGYSVANQKLQKLYSSTPGFPPPVTTTEDGVDLRIFRPSRLERFQSLGRRALVVGWVGNSAWESGKEDFKGLHTILAPAVEELKAEGVEIELKLADRQAGFIPHAEMPDYYAGIDVLVCSSKIEGTPNPVLEAMACGLAVISTDVGIVPEVFGERQSEYILPERSKDAMKAALRRISSSPEVVLALSEENLKSIESWDWGIKALRFDKLFRAAAEKRNKHQLISQKGHE